MRIVVLFNLKAGVEAGDYEAWAKSRDIPSVRSLPSIDDFQVYRTTGLLGVDGSSPYQYIEIIDVADMAGFFTDVAGETSKTVAAEFQIFADAPVFMLTEQLD